MQSTSKPPGIYIGPRRKLSGFDYSSTEHFYFSDNILFNISDFSHAYYVVTHSTLWYELKLLYPGTLNELRTSNPEYFI